MRKWLQKTRGALDEVFSKKPIVLVDVGASGAAPPDWRALSAISYYVGFDPDQRELRDDNAFGFRRFVMVNKAVADTDAQEVEFYLTTSPYCSSTLKPNERNLAQYDFTDLFRVQKRTTVPAIRLQTALGEVGLDYIDWLKLDSQGKDLDIFLSLDTSTRSHLLALDIEPGVVDFYEGENTYAPAHMHIVENGFWLSNVHLQQYARISKPTREKLASHKTRFRQLPGSPTAVEATYFRTLEHLVAGEVSLRDHVCLWVFSMLSGKYGFALDTAVAIVDRSLDDRVGELLLQQTLAEIERYSKTPLELSIAIARAVLPRALLQRAQKVLAAVRGN